MRPHETTEPGYTEEGYNQGYYDDDYYNIKVERENELLRQQLEEALRANEEQIHQVQQARRNPPGRPRKNSSRRTQAVETEIAMVREEPQARTGSVSCQATREAVDTQTQVPELPIS